MVKESFPPTLDLPIHVMICFDHFSIVYYKVQIICLFWNIAWYSIQLPFKCCIEGETQEKNKKNALVL